MSIKNGFKKYPLNSAFVLNNHSPEDVAKAMIESGKQKEPFHIFDMDEAYRRIQHFKDLMPRIEILYAMKANDYDLLLKLAAAEGLGFDCASPGEIQKVLELGINPRSIIYAMTTKTPEQMTFARSAGIKHTTFDTSFELKKIRQYWPDASLLIRIRVDSNSLYKLGVKFGCDFDTEATDLLDEAATLGLRVAGVAFHVGSACYSPESYEVGLRRAYALFQYEARAGRRMNILDIGGGFLSDRTDRIDEVANIINSNVEELFPDPSVQIIAEPGRYLCDSAATLYCNINNIRRWSSNLEDEELEDAILFGPSCDCDDQIMKEHDIRLPRCTPFDWLVFGIQGAYTTNFSSVFSCLPIPLIRPVITLELWDKIKDSTVFSAKDFVLNPEISTPLPSTMSSVPKNLHYLANTPALQD